MMSQMRSGGPTRRRRSPAPLMRWTLSSSLLVSAPGLSWALLAPAGSPSALLAQEQTLPPALAHCVSQFCLPAAGRLWVVPPLPSPPFV